MTPLERRFIVSLANRHGVNWGVEEVGQLNFNMYGVTSATQALQAQLGATKTPPYRVSRPTDGSPEVITNSKNQNFSFSIWQDEFHGSNFHQNRNIGLVRKCMTDGRR